MPASIDTLTTRFEADIQKFEANMKKMVSSADSSLGSVEARHQAAHDKLESVWGKTNIGEALEKTFSNARLGVLEEGATKIGIFGSALEALGPIGLAAGAALAAFGIGAEQASKAMEWAEDLQHVAQRLGITTTALQEMGFAALKTGVSQEVLQEGIQKVSQAIGAYTSNIKDQRVASVFEALGISKDDARNFDGPVDGLEKIADALAKIKDHSQQLALAKDLKVPDEMVPLLLQGGDKIREMAEEAHALGIVMDQEMVERAAEFGEKAKVAKDIIDNQLRVAFVNMAPAVLAIVNLMAKLATLAADAAESMHAFDWLTGKTDYSQFNTEHLKRTTNDQADIMAKAIATAQQEGIKTTFDTNGRVSIPQSKVLEQRYNDALDAHGAATSALLKKTDEAKVQIKTPAATALAPEKAKSGPTDKTDDLNATALEALQQATKDHASAEKALATSIQAKADAERKVVVDDTAEKITKLDKQIADIKATKLDSNKKAQIAELEAAKAEVQSTETLKLELITRQQLVDSLKQQQAADDQDAKIKADALSIQQQHFTALASVAKTTADRVDFERQALMIAQQSERQQADADVARLNATLQIAIASANLAEVIQASKDLWAAQQKRAALPEQQRLQTASFNKQNETPGQKYVDQLNDTTGQFSSVETKGLTSLTDGITAAIMQTKSLGQVFHDVATQIIADLVKIGVEQMITKPLAQALFGSSGSAISGAASPSTGLLGSLFASFGHVFGFQAGTNYAPGGLSWVGENGPELAYLPSGSQIAPNNLLRNAFNAPPAANQNGPTFNLTTVVSANDAVLTNTVQTWIAQSHIAAVQQARSMAASDFSSSRRNSLV